jgi:NAD(P)H-dependent FMN reductase
VGRGCDTRFADENTEKLMNEQRPLDIPVILGTTRKGRMSAHAANFMVGQLRQRNDVRTQLIDIRELDLRVDDAGEGVKDPRFADAMEHADGIVIVSPEYNHSFPGLLKHVLDSCLKEYIHKPAGIVGVSAGPFGGARMIESFQPVLRELGLVSIFWDVNFGSIDKVFDANGELLDEAYIRRSAKFINELVWMATVLRHGRENIPLGQT